MRASYRLPDKTQYSSRAISLIRPRCAGAPRQTGEPSSRFASAENRPMRKDL